MSPNTFGHKLVWNTFRPKLTPERSSLQIVDPQRDSEVWLLVASSRGHPVCGKDWRGACNSRLRPGSLARREVQCLALSGIFLDAVRQSSRSPDALQVSTQVLDPTLEWWESISINQSIYRFTARCNASAVLAMGLCLSVCLCLSQVGVLLKRLNVGSHKQHHTIAQGI